MRIVQAANFVGPTSGGIRTTLHALAEGYVAHGHEPVRIVPGPRDHVRDSAAGIEFTVASPRLPGSGGYRIIVDPWRVERLLDRLRPDSVELSDRLTLLPLGRWARRHQVRSVAISHERLDAVLAVHAPVLVPYRRAARVSARALAEAVDVVICASEWAAAEYRSAGIEQVVVLPLGVDLEHFAPHRYDARLRATLTADRPLVVLASRLSPEKRPELAFAAVERLARQGSPVQLVVAGDGPVRQRLTPHPAVTLLGHVADRALYARLLASADVALAPGPVETFGLAALEALASGTPVLAAVTGGLPERLTYPAGATAYGHPAAVAAGVRHLLAGNRLAARRAARATAERFPWSATVAGLLACHAGEPLPADAPPRVPPSRPAAAPVRRAA